MRDVLGSNKILCKRNFLKTSISNLKPGSLGKLSLLWEKVIFLQAHRLRYVPTCKKLQWLVGKDFNKNIYYSLKTKNRGNVSFKQARDPYWNDNS